MMEDHVYRHFVDITGHVIVHEWKLLSHGFKYYVGGDLPFGLVVRGLGKTVLHHWELQVMVDFKEVIHISCDMPLQ